jgi:hypothetical protein
MTLLDGLMLTVAALLAVGMVAASLRALVELVRHAPVPVRALVRRRSMRR